MNLPNSLLPRVGIDSGHGAPDPGRSVSGVTWPIFILYPLLAWLLELPGRHVMPERYALYITHVKDNLSLANINTTGISFFLLPDVLRSLTNKVIGVTVRRLKLYCIVYWKYNCGGKPNHERTKSPTVDVQQLQTASPTDPPPFSRGSAKTLIYRWLICKNHTVFHPSITR